MNFGLLAQGLSRARRTQRDVMREDEQMARQQEQDLRAREMAEIQQAALLAGLEGQGISQGGEGIPIGQTRFRQDPTRTRQAQQIAAERQRQERLNQRRAVLKARGLNPDEIDVENDDIYESYAKYQAPKGPQAPTPGTPEYYAMREREAQINAKYRPVRPPRGPAATDKDKIADFMLAGAERAEKTLRDYSASPRTWVNKVPGLGNYGQTETDQIAQQAAETLHDAYLRITTGATINPEELKRAAKQYIPEPGDSPGVLRAKAMRRKEIIDAMRRSAGRVRMGGGVPDEPDDDVPYPDY